LLILSHLIKNFIDSAAANPFLTSTNLAEGSMPAIGRVWNSKVRYLSALNVSCALGVYAYTCSNVDGNCTEMIVLMVE
jgi:hypothetical protein